MDNETKAQRIYQTLSLIPAGHVCSYGDVAKRAGLPGNARLVGKLLSQLPHDSSLPWHRVIRSDGRIAFPENSDAFRRQRGLLSKENIDVRNGKISMRRYGWLLE